MDFKEELRQKVSGIARSVNTMRVDLVIAIQNEDYEKAAQLRDNAQLLQQELILLVNQKK